MSENEIVVLVGTELLGMGAVIGFGAYLGASVGAASVHLGKEVFAQFARRAK